MKLAITKHAMERIDRIDVRYRKEFCKRVSESVAQVASAPNWAIKVQNGGDVVGYAVGRGREIRTLLSGGQTPYSSHVVRVWL